MDGSEEQSAEDLYEHAPCGYLSATPGGELVRVNETFLRWTGYSREQLVGVKRFQDLLTPGGRIYHETHYAPLLRMQGTVREIAVDIVCADRRRLPVLVNSVLLTDAAGEPRMVRTTLFDATERKSYERELLAARDRERVAREQVELLQRITAALAAASDAPAIAEAVTTELMAAFDAQRVAVQDEFEPGLEFDDEAGAARLALEAAPNARGGVLRLDLAAPRPFQSDERAFLIAVARQTALALERARLYEETRDVAHTLQRSLLAGDAPVDPRYAVTTLYQPAIAYLEVGGDWHDAFELPGGKVGITVGDVVGRGLQAASAMGQLRSAVRALAGAGLGPQAVVRHLDTFVEQVEAAQYATLVYAEVDPATGEVVLAAAGHLPPVLLGAEPELYMGGRSTPLGIPTTVMPRIDATFTLAPGEGFLLYTDGLVERRRESLDVGLDRLLTAIRERPDAAPDQLVETLVDPTAADDDVCVLVFRYHGTVPSSST
jgi:PAS domain S-box-containing protein